jgi:hypothetical protein
MDDRARFEAWARTLEGNDRLSLARHIGPGYVYSDTHAAWRGWQEAVKQERERLSLPKSYGGSTFSTWGDQKEGCTVRLHFTDAKAAEEWVNRLTDNWDAAIRARSSMESKT